MLHVQSGLRRLLAEEEEAKKEIFERDTHLVVRTPEKRSRRYLKILQHHQRKFENSIG